ncbi:uncharacterized protein G2W53_007910 [Senna tora]|uniref:Uncharacterized protein n=1 Tax=Senna tora TaxID=362788 RepID=A0A834X920_9FABA|nr:uncharacterized protein G2W53_007910 [Senna tora]
MARPLIGQYLSMLGILLSGTLNLIHNSVKGIQVRLRWANGDARCRVGNDVGSSGTAFLCTVLSCVPIRGAMCPSWVSKSISFPMVINWERNAWTISCQDLKLSLARPMYHWNANPVRLKWKCARRASRFVPTSPWSSNKL